MKNKKTKSRPKRSGHTKRTQALIDAAFADGFAQCVESVRWRTAGIRRVTGATMTIPTAGALDELERALDNERVLAKCRLFMETLLDQISEEHEGYTR